MTEVGTTRYVHGRWFEDYEPGAVSILVTEHVSEAEIIAYSRRYDPQSFHIDPVAAAQGPYGGVIASGWHTCSLAGNALVRHYLSPESSLPSPGIDEVRWHLPVRAGDDITWQATVESARPSTSRPDRGIVRTRLLATNQLGVPVASMTVINMIRRRPAS